MPLRVLIVPDKFKGTLTAKAAAAAIARGWRRVRPMDRIEALPMSDGGDGFGEVIGTLLGSRRRTVKTVDAAHRPCRSNWWWSARTQSAIIETSNVVGLARLPREKFHPFQLDTFGLGAVLRSAEAAGTRRLLIGIGGSATNDGGFGLARSLGWKFLAAGGRLIQSWTGLDGLQCISTPEHQPSFEELTVAVDVENTLLGPKGATRVYGPQKGLRPSEFTSAERCLRRLALVRSKMIGQNVASLPGSGAAGGLGFGFAAFLGAKLAPGFDLFAGHSDLRSRIRRADVVITGEGSIDASTLMGKGVGQVARICKELGVPCLGIAGVVQAAARPADLFSQARGLVELTMPDDAKRRAKHWVERLAARMAMESPVHLRAHFPPRRLQT